MKYFLALIFIILGVAYYIYDQGIFLFNKPGSDYSVYGIDVSHHQGEIDWAVVSSVGPKFVYIKATEGESLKDKKFEVNWHDASGKGMLVGAYHFFTLCRSGLAQAQNFTDTVPYDPESLPPAVDLEYVGNCSARPPREIFWKDLSYFLVSMQRAYNKKPIIYTTYEFYEDYLKGTGAEEYPLWIRDLFRKPDAARLGGRDWVIWQYSDKGRAAGIRGPVDLNVFRGSLEELINL